MLSKHKKPKETKLKDFAVRNLPSPHQKPWLRWLAPEPKRKALAKLRRSAGRIARESHAKKQAKSKGPKRLVWRVKPPRRKPASKNFNPVIVKGNQGVTTSTGYPGAGGRTTFVNQLKDDSFEWLLTWVTAHGDFKHPTPHSFRKQSGRYYAGWTYSLDKNSNGTRREGSNITGNYPTLASNTYDPSTYNNALGKLYDQIRGELDLSIDLAEVSKTRTMMRDTLKGMMTLAVTLRKMRRSNPRDWGNLWLEWTYGWKPTAQSIYQTAHNLIVGPKGPRFMAVIGKASTKKISKTITGNGVTTAKVVEDSILSNRCRIYAKFAFAQSVLNDFAGFTSLNPVSIAWELTPYSFVVDWFIDFGGYLRNFETACLYKSDFVSGYVSEGYKTETFGQRTKYQLESTGDSNAEFTSGWQREIGFRRYLLGSVPFPRAPRFDPKLGTSRLVSAAALLGQALTSLKHSPGYGKVPLTRGP